MPRQRHCMGACFNDDDCNRPIASGVQVCAVRPLFDAPTRNSQNIKDKHADRRAKNRATQYLVHVLPVLNCRGWKRLNMQGVLYSVTERIM